MALAYHVPAMDRVAPRRDVAFARGAAGPLTFDVYRPPEARPDELVPVVVFVGGFPDALIQAWVGQKGKDTATYGAWARAVAAAGLAAVLYENHEPAADLDRLLATLRADGAAWGLDARRMGLVAFSGHGPTALGALLGSARDGLRAAVLAYAYTLDLDGATAVADAAKAFGCANPTVGRTVADLPAEVPLLLVRAGADGTPGLNVALDRFAAAALGRDLPVTMTNHAGAPHAFDLGAPSPRTHAIIEAMLAFLVAHLRG